MKWTPQSLIKLHELINREDPRCLYCNYKCDFKMDGRASTVANPDSYFVEILTCIKCKEIFEIHGWDDTAQITDFVFTCKKIVVLNKYPQSSGVAVGFNIGNRTNLWPQMFGGDATINVAPFDIDFSDKNKLHKKLKTYLVFS